jgi:hypothetical protein
MSSSKEHYFLNGMRLGSALFANTSANFNNIYAGTSGLALYDSSASLIALGTSGYFSIQKTLYINADAYLSTNKFADQSGGINRVYGGPSGLYMYDSAGVTGITLNSAAVTVEKPTYINQPVALGASGTQFTRARRGTATLVGGIVAVADSTVTASTEIYVSQRTPSGTPGWLYVSARSAGTNFTVTSSSILDTSVISYWMIQP